MTSGGVCPGFKRQGGFTHHALSPAHDAVADPGFPRRGVQPRSGGANIFGEFLAETA